MHNLDLPTAQNRGWSIACLGEGIVLPRAKDTGIPMVCGVESQVLHYKPLSCKVVESRRAVSLCGYSRPKVSEELVALSAMETDHTSGSTTAESLCLHLSASSPGVPLSDQVRQLYGDAGHLQSPRVKHTASPYCEHHPFTRTSHLGAIFYPSAGFL